VIIHVFISIISMVSMELIYIPITRGNQIDYNFGISHYLNIFMFTSCSLAFLYLYNFYDYHLVKIYNEYKYADSNLMKIVHDLKNPIIGVK